MVKLLLLVLVVFTLHCVHATPGLVEAPVMPDEGPDEGPDVGLDEEVVRDALYWDASALVNEYDRFLIEKAQEQTH